MSDHLAAEALIRARLVEATSVRHVLAAAELAGVSESAQHTPALHIVYRGERLPNDDGDGVAQVVVQRWMVVVAVRHAAAAQLAVATDAVREAAGPLLAEAIAALSGWRPGRGYSALKRIAAPSPAHTVACGYFPLVFETGFVTGTV